MHSGARKRVVDWEPSEDDHVFGIGTYAPTYIVDPSDKKDADAFALLELEKHREKQSTIQQDRVLELEKLSADQWSDPFGKNAHLRKNFRREKRARVRRELQDAELRRRIGWDSDRKLASPSSSEPGFTTPDIRRAWRQAQDARPYDLSSRVQRTSQKLSTKASNSLSKAGQSLADRLLANSQAKRGKSSR